MSTRAKKSLTLLLVAGLGVLSLASQAGAKQRRADRETDSRGAYIEALHGKPGAAQEQSFAPLTGPLGSGSSLVGAAPVGSGPSELAADPATHTIYVANGENPNGPSAGGNTLSVIDTRHCNAHDLSRCKGPWPTITVGNLPSGIAIDQRTDTVYVTNLGDNTVSVFNGATCNAQDAAGCAQTPATVPVGTGPIQIFADPNNHTVYVATFGNNGSGNTNVSMIDSATCNATDLAACADTQPPTVNVGAAPEAVDVDLANHTVYVTTFGTLNGWSVFDANTCNATTQSRCGDVGYLPGDPIGPFSAEVDTANDTLYTADYDNTISAFDLADCNASDLSGCATDTPGTVTSFPSVGFDHSLWLTVDTANHSVYVAYQKDDALLVIDADKCNGTHPAGCATLTPPEIHTGADPESVILDPQTQTLYTGNEVDNTISVIDATRCDAQNTHGCRQRALEVPIPSGSLAADPAVATTYVASGSTQVAMIDTHQCNVFHPAGCGATAPRVTVGADPNAVAVNPATHTVYVANYGTGTTGTISVLDDRTCNAGEQVGCSTVSTLQVPNGNPVAAAVNPLTDTIYVATITGNGGPNLISVFTGATCNATHTTGCNQTPANAPTGDDDGADGSTEDVAVNPATNTIYATSDTLGDPYTGHTVYVLNGHACDATNTSGCDQTPATIDVGSTAAFGDANPFGIAVDQATDTIYTANIANGEGPGTISVINGATCNSLNTSGCGQTPAIAPAGFGTNGIAVDQITNQVYATNIQDTSVTTIDGNRCNGNSASGCGQARTDAIVGDYPDAISVDPFVGTAYIADIEGVSVIHLTP